MKKNSNSKKAVPGFKFDLKMKLSLILVFFAVFSIHASSYSQKTKITLDIEDSSVQRIIDEIEAVSEFKFIYETNSVDLDRKLTLKVKNEKIDKILKRLFAQSTTTFKIRNSKILLLKEEKEPTSKTVTIPSKIWQHQLSGTVLDQKGLPLLGATLVEKGTDNGTQTNFDGNFEITVADPNAVLIVSYIGYTTQEISVNGQSSFQITLQESASALNEVVVIGYGEQRKSDVTGSLTLVTEEDLQSRPVPSVAAALQGRSTGVQIQETGGDLEGRFNVNIRGIGSVNQSNQPLFVVDGVPLFNVISFSTINPRDIENVTILKDASATAIYGARASNGVVIITTKRGRAGKSKLTISTEVGFEQITNTYDLLSTEQQRQLFVEAFTNSNRNTDVYDDPDNPVWQTDTDWQDLGTRTAIRQAYNLSFTGGNEKGTYAILASIIDREGTLINTDLNSYSLRANADANVNDYIKISASLSGIHQRQNFINNDDFFGQGYRSLVFNHSYTSAFDENGELTGIDNTAAPFFGGNSNPLIDLLLPERKRNDSRIIANLKTDVKLAKGLTVTANIGGDIFNRRESQFFPVYEIGLQRQEEVNTSRFHSQDVNWVAEFFVNYQKTFGKHNGTLLVGTSAQQNTRSQFLASGSGAIDNTLNQLNNQNADNFGAESLEISSGLTSVFGRFNYDYEGKYLFTATVRRDGSSRFGPGNRYGVFPSGSVAWRLSEENFLKKSNFINDLKLRASYGETGNQNIDDFAFITPAEGRNAVFGNNQVLGNAAIELGNNLLQWESSKQLDIGLNATLFGGRISIEADYYKKENENLLQQTTVPLTSGIGAPIINLGSVENKGFEFSIRSTNILTDNFSWTTDFNISTLRNKVLDIGTNAIGEPLQLPGYIVPLGNERVNLTEAGREVGAFNTYIFDGIWQLGEEAEAALYNAVPGDARYVDVNGNGEFDQGDRTFTGTTPHPKFFGGINNTFTYKNWALNIFMNYAGGHQLYNTARNLFSRSVPFVQNFAEVSDFWTPTNPSNSIPRPSQGGNTTFLATRPSTRFLEDADFLRLKNVSISYDLPDSIIDNLKIDGARFTLSGVNLLTITGYSGLDPEASSQISLLESGIDNTPYPLTRLVSMAVEVSF